MSEIQNQGDTNLALADPAGVQQDLNLINPQHIKIEGETDSQLDKQASEFIKSVLAFDPNDPNKIDSRDQSIVAVETLGAKTQKSASHRSAMLKEPIRKLASRGEDGGIVANALVDLKNQIEELDPGRLDFKSGWFSRTIGRIPGIGSPMKKYFTRFESAQTVIQAIIRGLEQGKDVLGRDNVTLAQDQKIMRKLTINLEKTIKLGMVIDQKLNYALEREIAQDDPRRKFINDELIFPLRQRIQDLQQQLAVNQQGVIAIEIIIRNNKELIKGVDRGINVTVNALNVAVTVALALANQKIVLKKIDALNKTTNNLIAQTASQLRTQGAEIHKQASRTQLSMETLKKAFSDINGALDDISKFRQQALPQMANSILEMDKLTRTTDQAIKRMEQGNRATPMITLDFESVDPKM